MSARFGYTTRDQITEDLAAQLRSAADAACDEHEWTTCEPIWFMPELKDGRLDGSSKLLVGFDDFDPDDFDEDGAASDTPGGVSDARFIADTLAGFSTMDLADVGVSGMARVAAIDPCPEIEEADEATTRVVTATFTHHAGQPWELRLEGHAEPIGVTPRHLVWRTDTECWQPVRDLEPGARVRLLDGAEGVIESVTELTATEPVYNLEVDADHVYRVTDAGVLVHNTSCPLTKGILQRADPGTMLYVSSHRRVLDAQRDMGVTILQARGRNRTHALVAHHAVQDAIQPGSYGLKPAISLPQHFAHKHLYSTSKRLSDAEFVALPTLRDYLDREILQITIAASSYTVAKRKLNFQLKILEEANIRYWDSLGLTGMELLP